MNHGRTRWVVAALIALIAYGACCSVFADWAFSDQRGISLLSVGNAAHFVSVPIIGAVLTLRLYAGRDRRPAARRKYERSASEVAHVQATLVGTALRAAARNVNGRLSAAESHAATLELQSSTTSAGVRP